MIRLIFHGHRYGMECGAPRAKLMTPSKTSLWGDIPALNVNCAALRFITYLLSISTGSNFYVV